MGTRWTIGFPYKKTLLAGSASPDTEGRKHMGNEYRTGRKQFKAGYNGQFRQWI